MERSYMDRELASLTLEWHLARVLAKVVTNELLSIYRNSIAFLKKGPTFSPSL